MADRVVAVAEFPEARLAAYKLWVDFGPSVGRLGTSAQVTNDTLSELEGRMVVGALNLGSKRVAGFESELLLLGAVAGDGTVRLLEPDHGAEAGDPVA